MQNTQKQNSFEGSKVCGARTAPKDQGGGNLPPPAPHKLSRDRLTGRPPPRGPKFNKAPLTRPTRVHNTGGAMPEVSTVVRLRLQVLL